MDITVMELCRLLEMPEEVCGKIQQLEQEEDYDAVSGAIRGLTLKTEWRRAYKDLKDWIGEDDLGFKMLACMLHAMKITYENYGKAGMGETVFIDTMKCFARFIGEHKNSFGCYGFDRDWWVGRQLSMQLFRIGELEYEFETVDEKNVISIHIPSDARITAERCRDSYEKAVDFIGKFFPQNKEDRYVCCSWLLSPAMEELLPGDSRINCFRRGFSIMEWDKESQEFLQWVYKRRDIETADLPEDSLLQRNMKTYLLKGGKVGEAKGELVSSPWTS